MSHQDRVVPKHVLKEAADLIKNGVKMPAAPKPLLWRLAELLKEFDTAAAVEKGRGNDDALLCINAARARLYKVVARYVREMRAYSARNGSPASAPTQFPHE